MIRWISLFFVLLISHFSQAHLTRLESECQQLRSERMQTQTLLRDETLLAKLDRLKQRIQQLTTQIAKHCLHEDEIAAKSLVVQQAEMREQVHGSGPSLTAQQQAEKNAAWQNFYVQPTRCMANPLAAKDVDWCFENQRQQQQQFDSIWQANKYKNQYAEASASDSFYEIILPRKIPFEQSLKQQTAVEHQQSYSGVFVSNIIRYAIIAILILFALVFIYQFLLSTHRD
ncbi:hypothetical protein [Pseudoalteromonas mariniglutinosa]|uniref:hypothetical protein n=1 Tax=Pseudoalteromonas mariniglutinosa TaxID=206042 RepID=UPI00385175CF